ncbi:MAG: type IV pilus secretin PilQ [Deltaproteobacteria bacterium]|nr:type IV pilus secretin PilQ [Deltaproteobacteria bacterium]
MTGRRVSIFLALAAAALLSLAGPALAAGGLMALQGGFAPTGQEAAISPPASPGTPVPPAGSPGVIDLDSGPRASYYDAPRVFTGERISLDFQNADLHNIIRIIGEVSGKNIVVSDRVTGKVTLKLKDVPWDQALDIVLSSRNLGVEESGNVLTIYDLQTLNSIRADRGRLAAERLAAETQAPLTKATFTPKYAAIGVMAEDLRKLSSPRAGAKVVAIGNDIYVEDEPNVIQTMRGLFIKLDKASRQILIEARIVEVNTNVAQQLGIEWGIGYAGTPGVQGRPAPDVGGTGNPVSGAPGSLIGTADITGGAAALGFGFLNKAGSLILNARLNASEQTGESRNISAPRIMAANNQPVSIKQGVQIPYVTPGSANSPATTDFKEAAMELKVTPFIEENGQVITLNIDLKNDTVDPAYLRPGVEPPIQTKQATTTLMVRDGETVVIGGILTDTQGNSSQRVPGLHRLPLLGWLFQDNTVSSTKSELLIFITANIIPINI